jgi:hypothetical protein
MTVVYFVKICEGVLCSRSLLVFTGCMNDDGLSDV